MWDFGITRIADVTGLDVIGMPVYMAIRPNSRSLAVSQGKGIDRPAAKASALMESVESWHAERADLPLRYESWAELRRTARVVDLDQVPTRRGVIPDPARPILWVMGYDLMLGENIWIPYECVSLNLVRSEHLGTTFAQSSNGLASGNHILEAIAHALYEVVERDAVALWESRGGLELTQQQADIESVERPLVADLAKQLAVADVAVMVVETTADNGVPTFSCLITDKNPEQAWTLNGLFAGHGTHLDPTVAMIRAMSEAVQSRLTHISGSRDDMFHFDSHANRDDARAAAALFGRPFAPLRTKDLSTDSFEGDIEVVLRALETTGIENVVVVDLTRPEIGVPVAKVVVPGLEPIPDSPDYLPGRRATAGRLAA